MIIHYNCTIGSILLDSFLLIYHPYPPSFHEMIFILVGERERANLVVHLAAIFLYIYIYRYITGAAHTVIPIQRQHAHKIATSESETVSLQKAEEEETQTPK